MGRFSHCFALVAGYLLLFTGTSLASPSALMIPPSQYFEGNDGPWSTFNLRIGTDEQDVRVLISTAASETLVVLSEYGCSESVFSAGVPSDCAVSRGNMVNVNKSTTWSELGTFGINDGKVGLEANLGYSQPASFGLDTLGVGLVDGSEGVTLENQTIGGIAAANPLYLGLFGISTQPLNFSSLGNFSSPSFITTLKDQSHIPSLSWSYTAGAIYRLKKVYGQFIFSGYDMSRFKENSVSFTMADDITRDLVVALQSISYEGKTQKSILSSPINVFIDSTDPNLWLPDSAITAFESAFDISLDEESGLYLVNESHHSTLLDTNAEVSFRLSDVLDGGDTVTITLPYKAFDLQAETPLVKNTSYYFPLKRAANESQYTLGRAFLQEAYLTADYERRVFNVSQCTWVEGAEEDVITIASKDNSSSNEADNISGSSDTNTNDGGTDSSTTPALSSGAIAGIVIGAVFGACLMVLAIILLLRRRKQTTNDQATSDDQSEHPASTYLSDFAKSPPSTTWDSRTATPMKPIEELQGDDHHTYQLDSETKSTGNAHPASVQVYELPGCEKPRGELGVHSASSSMGDEEIESEISMRPTTPESFDHTR